METRNFDFKEEAEKTVKKVRDQLRYGSNNDIDKDRTDFQKRDLIRVALLIAGLKFALYDDDPTFPAFTKLSSLALEKYGYAQGREQAHAAFLDLVEKGVYPVDFCVTTDGGHNLLVVGRNPESDVNDISTWGENAFICDPWINKVYPLSEFKKMQEDTSYGKYNPEIYKESTIPPHYLSGKLRVLHSIKNKEELIEFEKKEKEVILDPHISDMFTSKITSSEEVKEDLKEMRQDFAALSCSSYDLI